MTDLLKEMQQVPCEFLVFSGGGAKGVIYSGVYSALKEAGVVDTVKAVAGSSAGAISAAIIAVGTAPKEFAKIAQETNLKALLGTTGIPIIDLPDGDDNNTPRGFVEKILKKGLRSIKRDNDGTPIYDLLGETIRSSFINYLNGKDLLEISRQRHNDIVKEITELQDAEIEEHNSPLYIHENIKRLEEHSAKLLDLIKSDGKELIELKEKCQNNRPILFKDLALLRLIQPEQFKDLLVTAVRQDNGELTIFNTETTPNVEIALACHASAAIPIVFKPVEIDGVKYVDGGYKDNTPMNYFSQTEQEDDSIEKLDNAKDIQQLKHKLKQKGRTLTFAFGSGMNSDAHIAIYSQKDLNSSNAIMQFLIDVIFKILAMVGGNFKYTETQKATAMNLRNNALEVVVLDTQGISTLDFNAAQECASYLHTKGYIQALEYCDNHEIGKKVATRLSHQKFFLKVYEEYDDKNLNKNIFCQIQSHIIPPTKKINEKTWQGIVRNHTDKANHLLSFCTGDRWGNQETHSVLESYIMLAASARKNEVKHDTKAIEALIKSLNDPTTPDVIKSDFVAVLGIDKNLYPQINKCQFVKEDFDNFLARNKHKHPRQFQTETGVGKGKCV